MKTSAVIAVAGFAVLLLAAVYLLRGGSRAGVPTAAASAELSPPIRDAAGDKAGDTKLGLKPATLPEIAGPSGESAINRENAPQNATVDVSDQQKKLREYLEASHRRIYEDIRAFAGLDAEETDALLKLLVDQQMLMSTAFSGSEEEQMAQFAAWQQGRRQAVAAQIGVSRAAAFATYEQSITARYEVDAMRQELEEAQLPLTEPQRKSLIASAIERHAYFPMLEFVGNAPTAEIQKLMAQIQVRDQRMLDVARGVLTSAQYSHYQQYQTKRHDLMEDSLHRAEEGK